VVGGASRGTAIWGGAATWDALKRCVPTCGVAMRGAAIRDAGVPACGTAKCGADTRGAGAASGVMKAAPESGDTSGGTRPASAQWIALAAGDVAGRSLPPRFGSVDRPTWNRRAFVTGVQVDPHRTVCGARRCRSGGRRRDILPLCRRSRGGAVSSIPSTPATERLGGGYAMGRSHEFFNVRRWNIPSPRRDSDDPWTLAQSRSSGIQNRNRDGARCPN
jgi:hypothetical protein